MLLLSVYDTQTVYPKVKVNSQSPATTPSKRIPPSGRPRQRRFGTRNMQSPLDHNVVTLPELLTKTALLHIRALTTRTPSRLQK